MDPATIAALVGLFVAVIFLILVAVFVSVMAKFFWLWIQSKLAGANIGIFNLLQMWIRKVDARMIVRGKIMAVAANITDTDLTGEALQAHYMAGGNVAQVIQALIAAKKSKQISLTFKEASAIDLAGRDVLDAVKTSVYPKVIDCPQKGSTRTSLDAVAKNGIQLKVKARVTVRANLRRLIGGATEETIIARVGEGIVSAIGSAEDHNLILQNPDMISKAVLAKRLDAETAFEIVSIDIADIDVGENIGARLQADRAEADMRVARARAEGRRAEAVAAEQEMLARIEESRAAVVEAEAEVPKAISAAFRGGQLGVLDYYRLKNVDADTEMRRAIASTGSGVGTIGNPN